MTPFERRVFAGTAYKRLWHSGYRGRFGFFSWPTEYTDIFPNFNNTLELLASFMRENAQNYDNSEEKAFRSAEGLRRLLNDLNARYPGRVDVVAHSMGNVVTAEALRTQSQFPKPGVVATYVASQAAVSAQAFNNTLPNRTLPPADGIFNLLAHYPDGLPSQPSYFSRIGNAARQRANFFNEQDPAMLLWGVGQALKPDRDHALRGQQYVRTRAPKRILQMPRDQYEIFCHCDPSPAKPLGAQRDTGGEFQDAAPVDLGTLGFTGDRADHSGQFYYAFSDRAAYWRALLRTIGDPAGSRDIVN